MRVGNSSEKYDASVAYWASCPVFMTMMKVRMMITAEPVCSSGKYASAQMIEPIAPHRNTRRRPTRSVSPPQNGITRHDSVALITIAASKVLREMPRSSSP